MQETKEHTRIPRGARRSADQGAKTVRYNQRKRGAPEKASSSASRAGNDFLKVKFSNVIAGEVGCGLKEISSEKDARHLYDSVENYFRLMGKTLRTEYTGVFEADAFHLHNELRANLPENTGINFDSYKGKLSVILFDDNIKFPDYTLFYFPICGIENMIPKLAEVFLHFLSFIRETQKIDMPDENFDFNWIINEWGEEYEEEERDENDFWNEALEMRKEYESGRVFNVMSDILSDPVPDAELERELNELLLSDFTYAAEPLINIMLEGLLLLRQDCIHNYDYSPLQCDNGGYYDSSEVIEFNRMFCFCWGHEKNDPVVNMAIDAYNNELQCLSPYGPAAWLSLTPETETLLETSNWPTRFAAWFDRFYYELENYM